MNSILDIPGASGISPRDAAESKGKYQLDPVTQLLADYITKQEAQQKALQAAQNPALNKSVLEEAVEKTVGGMMGGALGALQGAMPQIAGQMGPQMGAPAPQGMPPAPQGMPPAQGGIGGLDFAPAQMADGGIVGYAAGDPVGLTPEEYRAAVATGSIPPHASQNDRKNIRMARQDVVRSQDRTPPPPRSESGPSFLEQMGSVFDDTSEYYRSGAEDAARRWQQGDIPGTLGAQTRALLGGGFGVVKDTVADPVYDLLGGIGAFGSGLIGAGNEGTAAPDAAAPTAAPTAAPDAAAPAPDAAAPTAAPTDGGSSSLNALAAAASGAPGASAPQGLPGFRIVENDDLGLPAGTPISKAMALVNPEGESPFTGVMEASQKLMDGMRDEYAPVAASMSNILQTLKDKNTPEAIKRRREKDLSLGLAEFGFRLASTGKIGESALGTMSELKKTLEGREGEQLADLARIAEVQGARADIVLKPLLQGFQTSLAEAGMKQKEIDNRVTLLAQYIAGEYGKEGRLARALQAARPDPFEPDPEDARKYADEMLERVLTTADSLEAFNDNLVSLKLPQQAIAVANALGKKIWVEKATKDDPEVMRMQDEFKSLMRTYNFQQQRESWRQGQAFGGY